MNIRPPSWLTRVTGCAAFLVVLLIVIVLRPVVAQSQQQQQPQQEPQQDRMRAIDVNQSRAEEAADQLVSLSAENIISILQKEPGLLLEVKKVIVRKAYEQGRILDPQDLTDEAVYRTIARDENVRVLVTREIVDREYIRVKPTKEELAKQESLLRGTGKSNPETGETEEEFWKRRDSEMQSAPKSQTPNQQAPAVPAGPEPYDSRRAVQMAQAQNYNGDSTQDTGIDSFSGISATGLPLNPLGLQGASQGQMGALSSSRGGESPLSPAAQMNGAASSAALSGTNDLTSGLFPNPDAISTLDQPGSFGTQSYQPNYYYQRPRSRVLPTKLDQPMLGHRPNPYADVPSLYDLYSQYSQRSPTLERFGYDIFQNDTGNVDQLPMDLPAGPDYVVGPGDGLSIDLWGGVSKRLRRVVDREGKISLPEVGDVQVAGRTLGDVQRTVQNILRTQFRDVQANVSLARLRTVHIYVVGDVQYPGAYDVSSMSTPLNALYEAGGPTSAVRFEPSNTCGAINWLSRSISTTFSCMVFVPTCKGSRRGTPCKFLR